MFGNKRCINNLKDKITLKVNNDIEINCRTFLLLIWLELSPNISKCMKLASIPDSSLKKFLCFPMVLSILVLHSCCRLAWRFVVPVEPLKRIFAKTGQMNPHFLICQTEMRSTPSRGIVLHLPVRLIPYFPAMPLKIPAPIHVLNMHEIAFIQRSLHPEAPETTTGFQKA